MSISFYLSGKYQKERFCGQHAEMTRVTALEQNEGRWFRGTMKGYYSPDTIGPEMIKGGNNVGP